MTPRICTIDGCDQPWRSRRLCRNHYEAWRRRQQAYGRSTCQFVDAGPARAHIEALAAAGISRKRLHVLSGVPLSSLSRIVAGRTERCEGPAKQIMPHVEAAILAVPIPTVWWTHSADSRVGDPTGTVRRLRALVAIGWTQTELAARLGFTGANASRLFLGHHKVTAATARRVAVLFDELSLQSGPSNAARARGARMGWLRPLDWDDDALDDPAALPAIDPDDKSNAGLAARKRLSVWWRTQPCTVDGCTTGRKGLGNTLCPKHFHQQLARENRSAA